ncbi:MAG: hypothetical protein OQL09_01460 [Gammaproteobacteria bacterium]|nr:hypothetical protein [Gammaproteobacteria bacterium]
MLKTIKLLATLLLLAYLTACATVDHKAFIPSATQPIKTIGVIKNIEPQGYMINDFANPAFAFGAIGALAAMDDATSEIGQFNQLLKKKKFKAGALFNQQLATALKKSGYQVKYLKIKNKEPIKFIEDYSRFPNKGIDAYLDITMAVGYATVNLFDNDYRPQIEVHAQLISSQTKEVLYAENIMYGYHNPFLSATDIDAPQEHFFDNFSSFISKGDQVIGGLKTGIAVVSNHIGQQLQKK